MLFSSSSVLKKMLPRSKTCDMLKVCEAFENFIKERISKNEARLNKIKYSGGGLYLRGIVIASITTVYLHAEIPQKELIEIHNKLWYVDWAITATNRLSEATDKDFFKTKKRGRISKYRESIINVIGHALADCATMQNEFALNGEPRVITFKVDPRGYSPENWNAVILYNYVDTLMHGRLHPEMQEKGFTDIFEYIKQSVKEHYLNQGVNILNLEGKLNRAIKDIKAYNEALKINETINTYVFNGINDAELRTPNYKVKIKDIEEQYSRRQIEFDLNRVVTIESGKQAAYETKMQLKYRPGAKPDERWRMIDNETLQVPSMISGKTIKGSYKKASRCGIPIWTRLMCHIECDFELDISELSVTKSLTFKS